MATRKPSDIIKTVKNTARSYKDKHNAELRLEELLQKLDLPKPVTVGDIKDIIWNMPDDSKGASVLFSQLASYTKNRQTVEELKQVVTDAWNYFPHRLLGGKSPIDL